MKTLDMTGNPCPIPVVEAKKLLAQTDAVEVLVDNIVAVQNLEKMATGTGCAFSYSKESDTLYRVEITKGDGAEAAPCAPMQATAPALPEESGEGLTVLITGQGLGHGAEELGNILMKGFVFSLTQLQPAPRAVIFLNGGAHLTTQGANTVPDLEALAAMGTEILTCGTCANYYGLTEKLAVGAITDMMGITTRIAAAGRLVCL